MRTGRPRSVGYTVTDCGYATPCWLWDGHTNLGYGTMGVGRQNRKAHRVYWERENGPVPAGLELDHLCRQRACCNPAHLEPVTRFENAIRGAGTILTREQVIEIRHRLDGGARQIPLGAEYGVSQTTISDIKTGRSWSKFNHNQGELTCLT